MSRQIVRMGGLTPAPDVRPYKSNEEIYDAWHSFLRQRRRPPTVRKYGLEVKAYLRAWENVLVTEVPRHDFVRYIERYEGVCRNYRPAPFGTMAERCTQGIEMSKCPLLTGNPLDCPKYQIRKVVTTNSHLQSVKSLYDFLEGRGHLKTNAAHSAIKQWQRENKHREESNESRCFTDAEVKRLIRNERRPNVRFLFALLAKGIMRIEEALAMTLDPDYFNWEEKWILIPQIGGKRSISRGNHLVIIDDELAMYFTDYLRWRKHVVKKSAGNHLIVNANGGPVTYAAYSDIKRRWFDVAMRREGINQPNRPRHENAGPHTFRHWGTQKMKDTGLRHGGCDRELLELFRGCRLEGNMDVYLHMRIEHPAQARDKTRVEKLRKEYLRCGPQISTT